MKVFVHIPREDWIVDRMGNEFSLYSQHEVSFINPNVDVIWILSPSAWRQIPVDILKRKPVLCTIHHEVPEKFDAKRQAEFLARDSFVTAYHVPCEKTAQFISKITKKPIVTMPFWVNTNIWQPYDKNQARNELKLPMDAFIIGSFQRDTEGADLISPKLEKGPDRFCRHVELLKQTRNVHVLLGAWRRQYVIQQLNNIEVPFTYLELPPVETVRKMYSACDLYVIGSRYEGGPQAIFEAAATKTPIISTDVGFASSILNKQCIFDVTKSTYIPTYEDIIDAFNRVMLLKIDEHVPRFDQLLRDVT